MDYDESQELAEWVEYEYGGFEQLKARIAELERCVVMGGDGKPIAVGDIRSGWSHGQIVTGPARSISRNECGLVSVCIRCKIETKPISTLYHYLSPAAVYSSPDSVPEVEGGGE